MSSGNGINNTSVETNIEPILEDMSEESNHTIVIQTPCLYGVNVEVVDTNNSEEYEFVDATQNNDMDGIRNDPQKMNERFLQIPWAYMTEQDEQDEISSEDGNKYCDFQITISKSQKNKLR